MVYLLKKGIFHGYVKKPDGSDLCLFTFVFFCGGWQSQKSERILLLKQYMFHLQNRGLWHRDIKTVIVSR